MGIGASSLGGAADGAEQGLGRATLGSRNAENEGADAFQVGVQDAQRGGAGSSALTTGTPLATIPEERGNTAQSAATGAGSSTGNAVSDFTQEIDQAYRQGELMPPRRSETGPARSIAQPSGDRSPGQAGGASETAQGRMGRGQDTDIAGGSDVSTTRAANPIQGEIADFRRVANSHHYQQTDAERADHPSIALQQGRLSRAVDNMEAATDGQGAIRPGQQDRYNSAFREAADSSTQLIATQRAIGEEARGVQNTADASRIATGTRNGIIYSGLAGAGVAGITGGLIAWNNVREATHPASTGGSTTTENNSGTNTVNNNSTTNGTSNSTTNNNGATNGDTTNTVNGTANQSG